MKDVFQLIPYVVHSCHTFHVFNVMAVCGWCVQDGVLRRFDIHGEEVKMANAYNVDAPITSLTFSFNYLAIAMGSPMVSV